MSNQTTQSVEQLITDHIDIWSSSILAKSTAGRGSSNKYELYGINKLRELILELAVHGKLVAQDPNDEPALTLLKKAAKEKAQLVKEKRIKKFKKTDAITAEEIPFTAPAGWSWTRLQNIGHDWGQKKPDSDFTYIDVGSINKEQGIVATPSVLTPNEAPSRARKLVKEDTVIYSTVRPYLLNIAIIDKTFEPEPIASTAFAIIHPLSGITSGFVYHYLRSPTFINYVESCQTGMAYPAINDKKFFSGLIPIPPLAEQKRIIAKVDELMQLCDQLEQQAESSIEAHATLVEVLLNTLTDSTDADELKQNWSRLADNFDIIFTTEQSIEALKQTILQLAVMGKLVPQNPDGEPASVLLEKIEEEKQRLIESGAIKKDKSLFLIPDEKKPFSLPTNWEWCLLGNICHIERGGSPRPIKSFLTDDPNGLNWIKIGDTDQGGKYINSTEQKIKPEGLSKTRKVYPGDFLLTNSMSFGRPYITNIEGCIHDGWLRIHPPNEINKDFLYILLSSPYVFTSFKSSAAGAVVQNLNSDKVRQLLIALPPIAEQMLIASKVDELMQICDQLKEQLQQSQQTQVKLTDALVDQALA